MMTSADAKALACIQHASQEKNGMPVIEHLERVAAGAEWRATQASGLGLPVDSDEIVQAAWLHDLIEDTSLTTQDLHSAGYSDAVIAMVELLTNPKGTGNYIDSLGALLTSSNLGAILVKLAECEDNTTRERLMHDSDTVSARYAEAKDELHKAAKVLGYTGV
jgi:(p)ppGpp synthase/HD superfamily hydrolase